MGGVDRGRLNVRVKRHSLHYSIKMISYTIGAADVTHTHMGGARYHFHRLEERSPRLVHS
jgi:hypothetical protein